MKALIAMSGGVDSSVAAQLIRDRGYECIGCTMKLYDNADAALPSSRTCCSLDDVEDARSVARRLGIPYYVFNFQDEFREKVIGKFIESYERGLTPNPCIDCNRYMKFERLRERAAILGCDYVVTGHYARIEEQDGLYTLKKARCEEKDQSYVLYSLTQQQLAHTLFPLGELSKEETRRIAEESGFLNAHKPDSQDICFVPDGDYARVIEAHTGKTYPPGAFVSTDGAVLGEHRGIIRYTVGQRRGLGVSAAQPLYVCRLCPAENTVVLGRREELFSDTVRVGDLNWISGRAPADGTRCRAKLRYRQKEQPAVLRLGDEGTITLVFDEPQRAVTPGQAAVLYEGDTVLGGGTILSAGDSTA